MEAKRFASAARWNRHSAIGIRHSAFYYSSIRSRIRFQRFLFVGTCSFSSLRPTGNGRTRGATLEKSVNLPLFPVTFPELSHPAVSDRKQRCAREGSLLAAFDIFVRRQTGILRILLGELPSPLSPSLSDRLSAGSTLGLNRSRTMRVVNYPSSCY